MQLRQSFLNAAQNATDFMRTHTVAIPSALSTLFAALSAQQFSAGGDARLAGFITGGVSALMAGLAVHKYRHPDTEDTVLEDRPSLD